jgi:hypothetical protein
VENNGERQVHVVGGAFLRKSIFAGTSYKRSGIVYVYTWAGTISLKGFTYQRMTNGVEALHGDGHQRPSGHADGNSCDEKWYKINKSTINQ